MLCEQNSTALAAYLDGELGSDEAVAMQQHIAACPRCAAEIAEMVSLRRSLLAARSRHTPSADFRRRIQQQIAASKAPVPKTKPRLLRFLPYAIPLAAMLLVAIALLRYSDRTDAFSEVADLHVNALASANPFDVVSTDRHTVKPWFQGKVPFSFNVPELSGTGFQLLGGKLVYLHQQPAAQLIVALRQHRISVLIFQNANTFPITTESGSHNAFNVSTWKSQSLRFVILGDADQSQIDNLSQLFKQANP
ncbi:MAG TPA: anti-sigma factor [Acidobacteriaceae bacterium]|jgi:anti-sigma factor RsiW|nr:anti-sigma factor [Acidobacteriaceae bacterium]